MEAEPPAQIEGGEFVCSTCGLTEHYTYKGKQPPFCKKISFIDDSYVMKDPFSPPNKNQFLLLGSDCHLCNKQLSSSSAVTTTFDLAQWLGGCIGWSGVEEVGSFLVSPLLFCYVLLSFDEAVLPEVANMWVPMRRVPRHIGGCLRGSSGRSRRSCLRRGEGRTNEIDGDVCFKLLGTRYLDYCHFTTVLEEEAPTTGNNDSPALPNLTYIRRMTDH
uniref:Cysteine-rich DPF motif domain-containing protein 1 n=1 Tax=Timema genevievae TaxID=629358 RepID=A0A7R9PGP5_TIMGE|nr:unnamed protein product [Timema genevievae]